jgi:hypothetical protein
MTGLLVDLLNVEQHTGHSLSGSSVSAVVAGLVFLFFFGGAGADADVDVDVVEIISGVISEVSEVISIIADEDKEDIVDTGMPYIVYII